jgi:CheY-like chemotaxis protein
MKSVCLIDDDSIYAMLAKRLISLHHLSDQITEYSDGYEAYESLRKINAEGAPLPDVIFLDVNMPIWDGWDFLDEFAKLNIAVIPEIYIVSSSSHSLDREKAATYHLVKNNLIKPLTLEDLKTILVENS